MSWKNPPEKGLEILIENEAFYPVTLISEVDRETEAALGDSGIVLLKQLFDVDLEKMSFKTGLKKEKIEKLMASANKIINERIPF